MGTTTKEAPALLGNGIVSPDYHMVLSAPQINQQQIVLMMMILKIQLNPEIFTIYYLPTITRYAL